MVVDWMDHGRIPATLLSPPLLRGVHSTPDSLSERSSLWAPRPSVSEERSPSLPLRVFVALSISLPFGIIVRQHAQHFTGASEIQSSASQEKKYKNEKGEELIMKKNEIQSYTITTVLVRVKLQPAVHTHRAGRPLPSKACVPGGWSGGGMGREPPAHHTSQGEMVNRTVQPLLADAAARWKCDFRPQINALLTDQFLLTLSLFSNDEKIVHLLTEDMNADFTYCSLSFPALFDATISESSSLSESDC